jgi:hypothetical protein
MIPKVRTLTDAYKEIVAADPNTGISFYAFRELVISGVIPSRKVGSRYLINMDNVSAYFDISSEEVATQDNVVYPSRLRRLSKTGGSI